MTISLTASCLHGRIEDAGLHMDIGSKWTATADSHVRVYGGIDLEQLDAPTGVTVYAETGISGEYILTSGGRLLCK